MISYQSGDVVRVVNLPERTGMNDWIGSVERFDEDTQKYKIEVRSKGVSSFINLKPENSDLANTKMLDDELSMYLFSDILLANKGNKKDVIY
jgi:hypothetical protein